MNSKIIIDKLTLTRGKDDTFNFEVVDENDNPADGKAVVKLNKITVLRGRVENGKFSQPIDLSEFKNEEYIIDILFGGNNQCDPADVEDTLHIKDIDVVEIPVGDLQNASYRLTRWIDINRKVPGKILINKEEINVGYLLSILARCIKNLDKKDAGTIKTEKITTPRVASETISENIILAKDEYMKIVNSVISECEGEAPSYVNYNDLKIGFVNLLYSFAKIVSNSSSESGLVSSYTLTSWNKIIGK